MLLKSLLKKVERLKGFVVESAIYKKGKIIFSLRPHKRSKGLCSGCGEPASTYDHLKKRLFEFVPLWGIPVLFAYRMRRLNCPKCGIRVESVPWAKGKSPVTYSLAFFLASWAKDLPWQTVAERFHVGWRTVYASVKWVVDWGLTHRNLEGIEAIGVDEIHVGQKGKFFTLVYEIGQNTRRLLYVARERKEESLRPFFSTLGHRLCENIRYVCTDMWKPYLTVIKESIPDALNILDRFHIMSHINEAINAIRAEEARELKSKGYFPILKNTRYCFLKKPSNLTENQKLKLKEVLKYDLKSVRAYLLKESFQAFWEYTSPYWAAWFLKKWCVRAMRSRLEPMRGVVRMLRTHEGLILNWFKANKEFSAGVIEALNNNAKTTLKISYGIRSFEVLKIKLFHKLGALPEPPVTHRFC